MLDLRFAGLSDRIELEVPGGESPLHPEGKEQAAQYAGLVKEMVNRGAKGAFGATLNPLPDVKTVESVIGEDLQDVING